MLVWLGVISQWITVRMVSFECKWKRLLKPQRKCLFLCESLSLLPVTESGNNGRTWNMSGEDCVSSSARQTSDGPTERSFYCFACSFKCINNAHRPLVLGLLQIYYKGNGCHGYAAFRAKDLRSPCLVPDVTLECSLDTDVIPRCLPPAETWGVTGWHSATIFVSAQQLYLSYRNTQLGWPRAHTSCRFTSFTPLRDSKETLACITNTLRDSPSPGCTHN